MHHLDKQAKPFRFINAAFTLSMVVALSGAPVPAWALSQLEPVKKAEHAIDTLAKAVTNALTTKKDAVVEDGGALPAPDMSAQTAGEAETEAKTADEAKADAPKIPDAKPIFDISKAPKAVQHMRTAILNAARKGDLDGIVALMKPGPHQTAIGFDATPGNLETTLKDLSGDDDGLETLAIMMDVLSTGFVHLGAGTPEDTYVWPYFVAKNMTELTPAEKVDVMRLVTAGDFIDMQELGAYHFFRIGIAPDGTWKFFLAGD